MARFNFVGVFAWGIQGENFIRRSNLGTWVRVQAANLGSIIMTALCGIGLG